MACFRHLASLAVLTLLAAAAPAQTAQQFVQQIVDTERAANQSDHSQWIYLDNSSKPKERELQWVATTPEGNVYRVLTMNGRELPESEQQSLIRRFLDDGHARKKQLTQNAHDDQQIDEFLRLLPSGFLWTVTRATPEETAFHFVPDPAFRPPSRAARVFAAATGDMVADNRQHRIRSMHAHLMHDVTFGGGILGRLKEGSTFSLEQQQVAPSLWQLTAIRVHLQGNFFFFHGIAIEQDDERSRFSQEPNNITLDQAAQSVMRQPGSAERQTASR